MNHFKFGCPACGQRIETQASEIGTSSQCPICHSPLTIPAPEPPAVTPEAKPATTSPTVAILEPAPPPVPPPALPAPPEPAAPPPSPQIAVLTPEIKIEIVRAVRDLLKEEANWMPERTETTPAYAAKLVAGQREEVPVTSPEATCFSLIGAVLREFDRRNVATLAHGRRELLDEELLAAIEQVLSQDGKSDSDPNRSRPPLTHSQCLDALAALEKFYERDLKQAKQSLSLRKLAQVRIEDLVSKLESEAPITPEEVATALYRELEAVRERFEQLEADVRRQKRQ